MNADAFGRFIALVETDQQLLSIAKELETLKLDKENLEQDLKKVNDQIEQSYQIYHNLRKQVDILELEIKSIEVQQKDRQQRLSDASTTKEYFSLENELKALDSKKAQLEETLFELWQKLEESQNAYQETLENAPKYKAQIEDIIKNLNRRIDTLSDNIESIRQSRPVMQVGIDPELIEKYEHMRQSAPNPVVQIKRDSCSACFSNINQQSLREIKSGKLVACQDCYRLLYSPDTLNASDRS